MTHEKGNAILNTFNFLFKVEYVLKLCDNPEEWSDDLVCGMEVDTSEEGGNNSGEGVDTSGKRSERVEREKEG
jgi:hypothetical protein